MNIVPYFTIHEQECDQCHADIYIGYEAIEFENQLFCDEECLVDYLMDGLHYKKVYLTNKEDS